jgi:hypothetical protein
MGLLNRTAEEVWGVVAEIVKAATATTPLGMRAALSPSIRQVSTPAAEALQKTLFPTPKAAEPGLTVMAVKSTVEYFNVHCNPALGLAALRVMRTYAVPPTRPVPGARLSDTV